MIAYVEFSGHTRFGSAHTNEDTVQTIKETLELILPHIASFWLRYLHI